MRSRGRDYLASGILLLCLLAVVPTAGAVAAITGGRSSGGARDHAPAKGVAYSAQAGVALASPVPCIAPFEDMTSSDYFFDAVQWLYCHGAVSGYGDRNFKPDEFVTRAQIAKIVVLALDLPFNVPGKPSYADVPPDNPFYEYVESYSHYVGSCAGGCLAFHPYSYTTRGQLAKFIVLASCWPLSTPAVPTFNDVTSDNTFYEYVETAYSLGVISGYADGTFRPYSNITRGQVSKIVYKAVLQGSACRTGPMESKSK